MPGLSHQWAGWRARAGLIVLTCFVLSSSATAQFSCWTGLAVFGPHPGPRVGHAMAYFPPQDQVVLFGGVGSTNATWVLPGFTWSQAAAGGPAARHDTALTYIVSEQRLLMFSGSNGTADTWVWNGFSWSLRIPANAPSARSGHALAYDLLRDEAVLFGGIQASNAAYLNQTWVYTGQNWVQRFPGASPPARRLHAMAYDSDRRVVWLFGGDSSIPGMTLGDLWRWDGVTWTQQNWVGTGPTPRAGHAMVYDEGRCRLIVHGGLDQVGLVSHEDTWEWDGASWKRYSDPGAPTPRSRVAAAYDLSRARTIMYGGQDPAFQPLADTYTWEVPITPHVISHPSPSSVIAGQPASFSISAVGDGFPVYRWRRNGVPLNNGGGISGAFGPTLMIAAARPADAGAYDCLVWIQCAVTKSDPAELAVCCMGDADCDAEVDYGDINDVLGNWLESCP